MNSQKSPSGLTPLCVKEYVEEFKPKTKKISQKEKAELLALNLKWCGKCKKTFDLSCFSNIKDKTCRECNGKRAVAWRNRNLERANETRKAWRSKNSEKQKETTKRRRAKNPELARQKEREWYKNNKEKIRARKKELYYQDHEKTKEYFKLWVREQRENNPLFVLAMRIRQRTRYSFVRRKISKNKSTQEMLGCNWEEFKAHIESQFTEGMSWDRFKEIHIDHVIPLASATTEEELIKLAHYTNLQPLWAKDNMSKGAKMGYYLQKE